MGVPVITLVGPAFFERLSYSNLSNAGLPDLCAFSLDEYRQKAIALAADTPRRRSLRHSLRQEIKQRPLGQPKKFAEDFYALVKQIVTERK
jgi:predicted O-linked N-acetylglucosamine transferase (SPINDLY family)